jgi:hypothetical protein
MSEASTWMEVGLGLNGEVRDFLGRLRLSDPSLRWHEGSGFFTRRYEVVGSRASIDAINRAGVAYQTGCNATAQRYRG